MKTWIYTLAIVTLVSSCISKEEHNALKKDLERAQSQATEQVLALKAEIESLKSNTAELKSQEKIATQSLAESAAQLQAMESQYGSLLESNRLLELNYKDLLSSSSNRNQKLFQQLGEKQQILEAKEDSLNQRAYQIAALEASLSERMARIEELEGLLAAQDSAAKSIMKKIKDALYNFNDQQVSVELKNGKVYVSLSNEILFKSGSTEVDSIGVNAMGMLAVVLNSNPDIEVNIEGHTDTDKGVDNWDLSVKRATAIVRILTNEANKVDPKMITASGRGEFQPRGDNDTDEGKAMNRRIEVILTPNLDAIYEFLGEIN